MFRILSIFFSILFSAKLDAYTYNHNNLIKNTSSEQINYIHGKLTPVVIDKMNINTEKCKSVVSGIIISECSLRNNCKDMSLMDIKPIVMVRLSKIPGGNFISACNGFIDSEFNNYLLSQKGGVSFPKAVKNNSNLTDFSYKSQNYNSNKLTKTDMPKTINDLSFAQRLNNKKKGYEQWRPVYDNEGNCIKNCPYTIPNFLKPEIKVNKQEEEKESSEDKPNKKIEKSPETQTETETPYNETSTPEIPVPENSTEKTDIKDDEKITLWFYNEDIIIGNDIKISELNKTIYWDKNCSEHKDNGYWSDDLEIHRVASYLFKSYGYNRSFIDFIISPSYYDFGFLRNDLTRYTFIETLNIAKEITEKLVFLLKGGPCSGLKIYIVSFKKNNSDKIKIISGPYTIE